MINPAHHTPALRTNRKAFTLIELLVVIAIIAILAAILFPAFARARENARRASCQSNLKQVALGLFQYTQDYDEKFPMRYWDTPAAAYFDYGWVQAIQPYVKSYQLFQCPSEPNPPSVFSGSSATAVTDYGINRSVADINTSSPLSSFDFPSVTVLNFDFRTYSADSGWNDLALDVPSRIRHLEGANYSFVDGHVKWYRPEKVLSASTGAPNYYYDTVKCAATGASYAGNGNPTFCR